MNEKIITLSFRVSSLFYPLFYPKKNLDDLITYVLYINTICNEKEKRSAIF